MVFHVTPVSVHGARGVKACTLKFCPSTAVRVNSSSRPVITIDEGGMPDRLNCISGREILVPLNCARRLVCAPVFRAGVPLMMKASLVAKSVTLLPRFHTPTEPLVLVPSVQTTTLLATTREPLVVAEPLT